MKNVSLIAGQPEGYCTKCNVGFSVKVDYENHMTQHIVSPPAKKNKNDNYQPPDFNDLKPAELDEKMDTDEFNDKIDIDEPDRVMANM